MLRLFIPRYTAHKTTDVMRRGAGRALDLKLLPGDAYTRLAPTTAFALGGAPVYLREGRFLSAGVLDAIEDDAATVPWRPNSKRTAILVAAFHAVRDIAVQARAIDPAQPWKERRPVALLATPLVTLSDRTKELYDGLGAEGIQRSRWSVEDREVYVDAGRRLKSHRQGPIRQLRNTLTAHVDIDALRTERGTPLPLADVLLPPFADSLLVLLMTLNYRHVFTWIREPSDRAHEDESELMTDYPLAYRARIGADRVIHSLGPGAVMAEDPRVVLQGPVQALFDVHNRLAVAAKPPRPQVYWRFRDE